jgi:DNA-binding NarL/FixJ family response regulator
MTGLIRVAIIDDHPLFREGVVDALGGVEGIEVVGQGAAAADALRIAQEHSPDVMLLDVMIAGGGIEAASNVVRAHPNVHIIMLTAFDDGQHVESALKAGARGYLLKGSGAEEIVQAVRAIAAGDPYVAPILAARLLCKKVDTIEATAASNRHNLTSREAEVLALLARGLSNKEIARAFGCTERTVKHHMTSIMQKLNVRNRVQAVLKFQPRRNTSV